MRYTTTRKWQMSGCSWWFTDQREDRVVEEDSWQQEQKHREEQGADEELRNVVVGVVYSLS